MVYHARASNHGQFRTFVSPLAKSNFPLANFQINFQVSVYILLRASLINIPAMLAEHE